MSDSMTGRGFLLRLALMAAYGPLILMLAAGDLSWTEGWVFSAFTFAYTLGSRLLILRRNPGLIKERAESMGQANVEPWDRVLVPLIGVLLPTLTVLLAGLDRRFGWSPDVPLWIQALAYVLMVLGGLFALWAAVHNSFFSAVVRIQKDRGQTVVMSGPYRFIRHPGYAGGLLFHLGTPFALGRLWALIPVFAVFVLTFIRTALEDRTLHRKLPGYPEYAARIHRRLIPGIW